MLRNLLGFAVFAIVAIFLLKVIFGLFGLVLGLAGALLWFAFLGFLIYPGARSLKLTPSS
jgi:hypothetical protein